MSAPLDIIKKLPGYKIPDSHFRIGSKIHISDFYYAKRLFQNNFFASRFAFLVTEDILSTLTTEDWEEISAGGLSLIGYGLYSELLLTLVEKFLLLRAPEGAKINHNLVLDDEKGGLVKTNHLLKTGIIIIPIASTFSTALKIEATLQNKPCKILSPHFNILLIDDEGGEDQSEVTELEKEFGWTRKNPGKKEIEVQALFSEKKEQRIEKYRLRLNTHWRRVRSCPECFPLTEDGEEDLLREKPLFETDRTTVTPSIIFDLPRARKIEGDDRQRTFRLNPGLVQYGHHMRNKSHFLYSIDTEGFLRDNLDTVREWLGGIKRAENFKQHFPESSHILLVSSGHYSNAAFVNLVNEELFSSAANIIHYDPTNDYIQNFEMIYGEEIREADKIVFVDDALKSGSTFLKIDEFVSRGIDLCILLLNLSQPFTAARVQQHLRSIKEIQAFCNLNLFTSLSPDERSPLLYEEERYNLIIDDCLLDSLRIHFQNQTGKLSLKEKKEPSLKSKERHLLMLIATHRIYAYFSLGEQPFHGIESFADFMTALREQVPPPVRYALLHENNNGRFSEEESATLKVLTQSPFTLYEPLRKKVFAWVLQLLDTQVETVRQKAKDHTMIYEDFEDLKFLIRRAGLLNSNYLISRRLIEMLETLYSTGSLQAIEAFFEKQVANTDSLNSKLTNLRDFPIFFAAQVKELLLQNEARSVKLEELLQTIPEGTQPRYKQILRILREENTIVIQKFYQFLSRQEGWKALYHSSNPATPVDTETDLIEEYLQRPFILGQHRYHTLNDYLRASGQQTALENSAFLTYLWIRHFIAFDGIRTYLSLTQKTDYIFQQLKKICVSTETGNQITLLGGFLIVKDSQDQPYLIYDRNNDEQKELGGERWKNDNDSFIQHFLDGSKDPSSTYFKTIIELGRSDDGWKDLFSTAADNTADRLSTNFLPQAINRIILMRLNNCEDMEKSVGLVGFYFKTAGDSPIDMTRVRYLLLLRKALGDFVEKHHRNNEFRDWLIAENSKKLAMLSGHGKEMLISLAADKKYRDIVLNLEHLQMIILIDEQTRIGGGRPNIRKKFRQFYDVGGTFTINEAYKETLFARTKEIFKFEQIENEVEVEVDVTCTPSTFQFAFNKNLLDLIGFELLVNAKKNRWHFLDGESFGGFSKNQVWITLSIAQEAGRRRLVFEIENLGPKISSEVLAKMNNPNKNVKDDDAISGTALIKNLVINILGGEIEFSQKPVSVNDNFYKIKATVILNEMTEQDAQDPDHR